MKLSTYTHSFMNTHEVHVMNLSTTAKERRAALADQECRGEPYSQEIPHAEQGTKPGTYQGFIKMMLDLLV